MTRDIAKKWQAYDGAVTAWMLPYRRFGFMSQFNTLIDATDSDANAQHFALLDWCLVDIEVTDDAPVVWKMLAEYVDYRDDADLTQNWELFQKYGSVRAIEELNIAFEATREKLLSDTYYDSDNDDPNLTGAGTNAT